MAVGDGGGWVMAMGDGTLLFYKKFLCSRIAILVHL